MARAFLDPRLYPHHRRRRHLADLNSFTTPSCGRFSSRPTSIAGAPWSKANYELALRTSCGILEAIVTDALEHKGLSALAASGAPAGKIADWSFETRLAVAESAGLIRSGCARLPAVARSYRDHTDADGENGTQATVSERDARQAGQVLHVMMRDLDPGR